MVVGVVGNESLLERPYSLVRHHRRTVHYRAQLEQLCEPLTRLVLLAVVEDNHANDGDTCGSLVRHHPRRSFLLGGVCVHLFDGGDDGGNERGWVDQGTGEDVRTLRVKLVHEFGHASKVAAAAADGPEEIWMGRFVHGENGTIGGDQRDLLYMRIRS